MSEIKVRAAKVADEDEVLAMAHREMRANEHVDARFRLRADAEDRYTVYLRDRMRDIDSSVFVAEFEGKVVGLAVGSIRKQDGFFEIKRYGYVSDLMVAPAVRRRGIGRALYDRVALWFRGLGIGVVRLHVSVRSDGAREFWKKLGAEEYLAEEWIDLRAPAPAKSPPATESGQAPDAAASAGSPAGDPPGKTLTGGPAGGFLNGADHAGGEI